MTLPAKIVVLGGDGVGPEVTNEAVKVLGQIFNPSESVVVEFDYQLIGGAAIVKKKFDLQMHRQGCEVFTLLLLFIKRMRMVLLYLRILWKHVNLQLPFYWAL